MRTLSENVSTIAKAMTAILLTMLTSLGLQGQTVDYRSFAHYNKRVAEFSTLYDIDSATVVMLGNSLTENGGNWASRIGTRMKVVNRGIIGDNTIGMTQRLCQITPHKPLAIFLMAGINDMSGNLPAQQVASRVINLIDSIRAQAPDTRLFVQSILPINEAGGRWKTLAGRTNDIPWANMLIRAYCESKGIVFVDIFPKLVRGKSNTLRSNLTNDGLHLNDEGYKIWAFELRRHFMRLQKRRRM
jgi:lysophospholipase L1-like esterase